MKNEILITIILCFLFLGIGNSQCLEQPHTPFEQDGWLSCQISINPNSEHGQSHWIMYDLGWEYILDSTHFWNYNVWGNSDAGVKGLIIDYSLDAVTWSNLGTFELERATASVKYEGVAGPSFNNTPARYVLLTATSNWGTSGCVGLSELRFNIGQSTAVAPDLDKTNPVMTVSPNPVIQEAQVSFNSDKIPEQVGLYDLSGKLIREKSNISALNVKLDMSDLPGGIYFIKARLEEQVLTEKVIKI